MKKAAVSTTSKSASKRGTGTASERISQRIAEYPDWRGAMLAQIRATIRAADPEIVEEWKWMGTPVWSHGGIVCTGETYKEVVKMTFARGAFLNDPSRLFNSSLEGNMRRAIDVREGEKLKVAALKALVKEAVALNLASKSKTPQGPKKAAPPKKSAAGKSKALPKKGAGAKKKSKKG